MEMTTAPLKDRQPCGYCTGLTLANWFDSCVSLGFNGPNNSIAGTSFLFLTRIAL